MPRKWIDQLVGHHNHFLAMCIVIEHGIARRKQDQD
jgi:hypothetical protein